MSIGRAPIRQRNSRSFRQCPSLETMINVGVFTEASKIPASMLYSDDTGAKAACSAARFDPAVDSNTVRMKNRLLPGSPCWALSMMLQPCSTRNLDTEATMPMRSGHERVRTKCGYAAPADFLLSAMNRCGPFRFDPGG